MGPTTLIKSGVNVGGCYVLMMAAVVFKDNITLR
jgi:hypothetical protein